MTIPIVPSRSLLSSSHSSTFSKQPYNGRHAGEKVSLFRNVLSLVGRMNHVTIQFTLLINKYPPPPQSLRDVRITVWGVKLQNYSWVTTHICRPVLYFAECISLMYSNLGSSTGQGQGRRRGDDLMEARAAKHDLLCAWRQRRHEPFHSVVCGCVLWMGLRTSWK